MDFDKILNLIEIYPTMAASLLTIIGWFAIFWFGLRQQKKHLRNEARMKVYEELYKLKQDIDKVSESLGLMLMDFSPPFMEMTWKQREKAKDGASFANLAGLEVWNKFCMDFAEKIHEFVTAYLKFWNHFDMWVAVMPKLKKAKEELFVNKLKELTQELYAHQQYLQGQSVKEFYWEKWDQKEIKNRSRAVGKKYNEVAIGYLDDFMGLIQNRLIKPIFGYRREPREGFNLRPKRGKILTEEGEKEVEFKD